MRASARERVVKMDPEDRVWTTAERNTLLNLIQDGGFIPGLTQEFVSNRATFERLSVLLNRCNIRVSKHQVEAQWQLLKEEFWKRKWMVDDGLCPASALTSDFPFYEELEQILISQKPAKVCKREADSSGMKAPSLLDSEDPVLSTNLSEEEVEERQNDAGPDVEEEVEVVQNDVGPHVNGEAPGRGVQPSPDLQWCRHTLDAIVQNLLRLQECIQDVLRDIERVNHMFSF
ncbi:uncharacterized protein LOC120928870 isoform X2 [Rana temporaria]|uniref:uncharacterized protein LOC120928870 isoform X2 n=1 Tax=Rana temporaria TaxID=8407 RepID=UPI001AAD928F|nr:uncharacterized protein LOC120928870 isoform X2 [Rana temporaria]